MIASQKNHPLDPKKEKEKKKKKEKENKRTKTSINQDGPYPYIETIVFIDGTMAQDISKAAI